MTDNHNPLVGSHKWYVEQQKKDRRDRIAEGFAFALAGHPSVDTGFPATCAVLACELADALIAELDK